MFSLTTKILSGISFLLFISTITFYSLYSNTSNDLKLSETQNKELQKVTQELVDSKDKLQKSKSINEKIIADKEELILIIRDDKDGYIKQLNDIKSKRCVKPTLSTPNIEVNEHEADIDDTLPDELIRVLSEIHNKRKRSSDLSP